MPADTQAPVEPTRIIDALGRYVTAEVTPSGLLVILTRTADEGLRSGHPALNAENARELGNALLAFADGEGP
jgi:hypothetical protein